MGLISIIKGILNRINPCANQNIECARKTQSTSEPERIDTSNCVQIYSWYVSKDIPESDRELLRTEFDQYSRGECPDSKAYVKGIRLNKVVRAIGGFGQEYDRFRFDSLKRTVKGEALSKFNLQNDCLELGEELGEMGISLNEIAKKMTFYDAIKTCAYPRGPRFFQESIPPDPFIAMNSYFTEEMNDMYAEIRSKAFNSNDMENWPIVRGWASLWRVSPADYYHVRGKTKGRPNYLVDIIIDVEKRVSKIEPIKK